MAGLNSILKIFLPKDRVFYQLFESVAEELVKMGDKIPCLWVKRFLELN